MKKILLFLFIIPSIVIAQKKMDIILSGGATYSTYKKNDLSEIYKGGIGFIIGATGEYHLNEKWSLVSGLNFENKLVRTDYEVVLILPDDVPEILSVKNKINHNYITLPFMGRFSFDNTKLKIFINAGGFLSYLVHASFDGKNTTSNYNKIDYGFAGGIGIRLPINDKNNLIIELRDHLGLNYLLKNGLDRKINSLNLSVGISL